MKHLCLITGEDILNKVRQKKQRRRDGKFNCLPFKFARAKKRFPGFERGKYYLFSANQKVGKSKLVDDLFLHYPDELRKSGKDIHTKVLYFSFEESEEDKAFQMSCYSLYKKEGLRMSPNEEKSLDREIPDSIVAKLSDTEVINTVTRINKTVEYVDEPMNPTGVYKKVKQWLETLGHYNYCDGKVQDPMGNWVDGKVIDKTNRFTFNDPELYAIVIIDNYANLNTERGWNQRETIEKMSKYCIELAKLGLIMVGVQHQAQSQEGIENLKYSQVIPSVNGLGDAKTTARDAHTTLGLFSPYRFQIRTHLNYDITEFKDYIRFLYIIADRNGAVGTIVPLLFRGDVSTFEELPQPDKVEILKAIKQALDVEEAEFEETFVLSETDNIPF